MHIDLKTVAIEPKRIAFDHMIERFGEKAASRYQEASYDLQAEENFHYKPTWDPQQELYDESITKIVMEDWYAIKDPRQFFYSTYTLTRARQQENIEANFKFVESRGLIELLDEDVTTLAKNVLIPLRHAAWGANQNNTFVCAYGYGTTFTQPCIYHAMDNLAVAQYLSRVGLLLGDVDALAEGKEAWQNGDEWQPLRRYTEDTMVVRDPFELFVAQNIALDGILYPIIYNQIVDGLITSKGGSSIAMLTSFMPEWFDETKRWLDSVIKVVAAESDENKAQIAKWLTEWNNRAAAAVLPVVEIALGDQADQAIAEQMAVLKTRMKKAGVEY